MLDGIKGKLGKEKSGGKGKKRGFAAIAVALGGFLFWRNRNKKQDAGTDFDTPAPGTPKSAAGE